MGIVATTASPHCESANFTVMCLQYAILLTLGSGLALIGLLVMIGGSERLWCCLHVDRLGHLRPEADGLKHSEFISIFLPSKSLEGHLHVLCEIHARTQVTGISGVLLRGACYIL